MINPLLGVAVADALGKAFELLPHDHPDLLGWDGESFVPLEGRMTVYQGSKIWMSPLEAEQWTDDTQMTLCLARAMIEVEGYDAEVTAAKYLEWYESGKARGMGPTVKAAMENLKTGLGPDKSGIDGAKGTGTAMRAIPLGVFPHTWQAMRDAARQDAHITHRSFQGAQAAIKVAELAHRLMHPADNFRWLRVSQQDDRRHALPLKQMVACEDEIAAVDGTGMALYHSAAYCLFTTDGYKDAVRKAIRMGGDTDTRAAIVGGWAGIRYGVPLDWAEQVEGYAEILDLEVALMEGGW